MAESREWTYGGAHGTLVARSWSGHDVPTHVVVIAHGYGEHVGRYEHVADALVRDGAVVYAVDHVGHGKSEGERVLVRDFEDVVGDLHALVLSSPVLGRWDAVSELLALEELPDAPLDVTMLSRDQRVGEVYAADPLVWHGPFKRATLEALRRALEAIASGPSLGDLPLMWIHGTDDQLVPVEGSRVGIERLRGPHYVERIYPEGRHEMFNELNAGDVIADVAEFIRGQLAVRR